MTDRDSLRASPILTTDDWPFKASDFVIIVIVFILLGVILA